MSTVILNLAGIILRKKGDFPMRPLIPFLLQATWSLPRLKRAITLNPLSSLKVGIAMEWWLEAAYKGLLKTKSSTLSEGV